MRGVASGTAADGPSRPGGGLTCDSTWNPEEHTLPTIATWAFSASSDTAANVRAHLACIDEAADRGADLVVFSEASVQGYQSAPGCGGQQEMLADAYARAEPVPAGASVQTIVAKAAQRRVHVIFGISESGPVPGILYNTAVLAGPGGYAGCYRKVHLGLPEQVIWTQGRDWLVFDTPLGRIGLALAQVDVRQGILDGYTATSGRTCHGTTARPPTPRPARTRPA